MIGIGSSPGAPRSSIMFLMSMLRSATLRSVKESVYARQCKGIGEVHTAFDLDVVRRHELDFLLTLGRHDD